MPLAATMPLADDEDTIDLFSLLHTVVEHLRLLVLVPLVVGCAALGLSFLVAPTFTAKTQFLPPQQQQSSASALLASLGGAAGGLAAAATGLKNPADQYVAYLKSETVLNALVAKFGLVKRYEVEMATDARKTLLERTRASAGKDGLVALEVDDTNPEFAATLANAYLDELRVLMSRLAVTEAQQRRVFFEQRLLEAKTQLTAAEVALGNTGVTAATLKSSPVAAVEGVARLKAGITAQEVKIGGLRGYLKDGAPEVRQALVELAALRAQLTKAEREEPGAAGTGKPEDSYIERFRDFKYKETLYELFVKQYELARVDEAREGAVIQVVDVATPPERKARPKKALIAIMATLASGALLLVWVFVRQGLRSAAANPETALKLAALKAAWRRSTGRA